MTSHKLVGSGKAEHKKESPDGIETPVDFHAGPRTSRNERLERLKAVVREQRAKGGVKKGRRQSRRNDFSLAAPSERALHLREIEGSK